MRFEMLAERYFFEISLLCEAYSARAVLRDVPMPPRYADEPSSLSPAKSLFEFLPRLVGRLARRIGYTYFLHDFNLVSVFLCAGRRSSPSASSGPRIIGTAPTRPGWSRAREP